jgi:hypothetical protein
MATKSASEAGRQHDTRMPRPTHALLSHAIMNHVVARGSSYLVLRYSLILGCLGSNEVSPQPAISWGFAALSHQPPNPHF